MVSRTLRSASSGDAESTLWWMRFGAFPPRDRRVRHETFRRRDGTGKGCGYEYWSRRPFRGCCPGSDVKRMTHRVERRRAKAAVRREVVVAERG